MKELSKMTSIEQFRHIVQAIQKNSQFVGFVDNEPKFDHTLPFPNVKFTGTVKLHGTNAAVGIDSNGKLWAQSKSKIITPGNDNFGFAQFAESNRCFFHEISQKIDLQENQILYIYGEWAGKGIQKNVGISEIDKTFYIFSMKIKTEGDEVSFSYIPNKDVMEIFFLIDHNPKIRCIFEFRTFEIEINFNEPELFQNQMIEMMEEVEKECPVTKQFLNKFNGIKFEIKDGKIKNEFPSIISNFIKIVKLKDGFYDLVLE